LKISGVTHKGSIQRGCRRWPDVSGSRCLVTSCVLIPIVGSRLSQVSIR